jgi:hypothetical protein
VDAEAPQHTPGFFAGTEGSEEFKGGSLIKPRHQQPSLWHKGLVKDIEDLWEPWRQLRLRSWKLQLIQKTRWGGTVRINLPDGRVLKE